MYKGTNVKLYFPFPTENTRADLSSDVKWKASTDHLEPGKFNAKLKKNTSSKFNLRQQMCDAPPADGDDADDFPVMPSFRLQGR